MATKLEPRYMSAREFLAIDFGPDAKAELDNGLIRMMAGGTRAHDRVQTNLIAALHAALRGSGCRPRGSDMAVVTTSGSVRYPDVSVTYGEDNPADDGKLAIDRPRVVIEVLSPSTEAQDHGVKFAEYRGLASIAYIALIDADREAITAYERWNGDAWHEANVRDGLEIRALGVRIGREDIFARD